MQNSENRSAQRAHLELMTDSRLRSFRACRRLHYFRYQLRRRPIVKAKPLAMGTLLHVGLEDWWRWWMAAEAGGKRTATPLETAMDAMAQRISDARHEDAEIGEFDVAAAEAMIAGYDARWFDDVASEFDVLGVEVPFVCQLVNPDTGRASQTYRRAGKIDAVVRQRRTGRVGFVEHKSTGASIAPESSYWRKLRMDGQVSGYYSGGRAVGLDLEFCLYDVLSKPTLKPLEATPVDKRKYRKDDGKLYANQREHDETPDEYRDRILADISADPNGYFGRAEVVRLDEDLREFAWDTWSDVKMLHEARLAGRHARNPEACFAFNRACDYFDVCTRVASIDDDFIYQTVQDAHEELGSDAAALEAAKLIAKSLDEQI